MGKIDQMIDLEKLDQDIAKSGFRLADRGGQIVFNVYGSDGKMAGYCVYVCPAGDKWPKSEAVMPDGWTDVIGDTIEQVVQDVRAKWAR